MGGKKGRTGKKKEDPVFQEEQDSDNEAPETSEQTPTDAAAAPAGLKPVKKAKVKKMMRRETAVEPTADGLKEDGAEQEIGLNGRNTLPRSVWIEVDEAEGGIDVKALRRVLRTVGEVEETKVLAPHRVQCRFVQIGSVRQALLLHNKAASQLPQVVKKPNEPRLYATSNPDARVSFDLPLPSEYRVAIKHLPSNCENSELGKCLGHYGRVSYIFRNAKQHYGFAAFTTKAAANNAVSDEAVMIRGTLISISRFQSKLGQTRKWQESQTNAALQYLHSLVPLNPYVLASPSAAPASSKAKAPSTPLALAPSAVPENGSDAAAAPAPKDVDAQPAKEKKDKKEKKEKKDKKEKGVPVAVPEEASGATPAAKRRKKQ